MTCLRYLSQLNHQWKYVQYLSGVDVPLKTNLEMVRIFKRLNGTINAEVTEFPRERFKSAKNKKFPMPLWKSSLSSLLPRATVDAMVQSEKVRDLLSFLQNTYCPDETLWTTIGGNPAELPIPNSFNATAIYAKLLNERSKLKDNQNSSVSKVKKIWASTKNYQCFGKIVSGSCVFGIGDLENMLTRPELIAHKFYFTLEPAAYFCLYYAVRSRAYDYESQTRFQGTVYEQLPQVRMAAGAKLDDVKFHFSIN
uniref:Uncharacterized protein n=1 Tax=Ditylenchus dipsaci TaxID=166011 RepID=A0A915DY69_9BILA